MDLKNTLYDSVQFSSVTQSCLTLCNPMNCSTPGLPVLTNSRSSLKLMSIELVMPSGHLILCHPLLLLPSSPAAGSFLTSQFFTSGGQRIAASALVLPVNIQDWFPLGWTGWITLNILESQEYSPIPQFKSINASMLSFLYSPTLTSIHDNWKNHSFDYIELFQESNVSLFFF